MRASIRKNCSVKNKLDALVDHLMKFYYIFVAGRVMYCVNFLNI